MFATVCQGSILPPVNKLQWYHKNSPPWRVRFLSIPKQSAIYLMKTVGNFILQILSWCNQNWFDYITYYQLYIFQVVSDLDLRLWIWHALIKCRASNQVYELFAGPLNWPIVLRVELHPPCCCNLYLTSFVGNIYLQCTISIQFKIHQAKSSFELPGIISEE